MSSNPLNGLEGSSKGNNGLEGTSKGKLKEEFFLCCNVLQNVTV